MQHTLRTAVLTLALTLTGLTARSAEPPITHSFLACGGQTRIVDGTGKAIWTYPHATRDGYVLPSGNLLLALSKSKDYPGVHHFQILDTNGKPLGGVPMK